MVAPPPSWFRRRLAWRLCGLFIAGALLPVALSDWLVIGVMGSLASKMDADRRVQTVRAASRQVFDRIALGEVLLQSFAVAGPASLPLPQPVFERLWCPRPGGGPMLADRADPTLPDTWRRAAGAEPTQGHEQVAVTREAAPRVLVAAPSRSGQPCIGEFAIDFLWQPLINGPDDAVWSVHDAAGRTIAHGQGGDVVGGSPDTARWPAHEARLFMGSAGNQQEWIFVQAAPEARVDWHDRPVLAWMVTVAAATLLTVGLVGQSRIRRALAPLERLTSGARSLATGAASTRVDVQGDDEIGQLAGAFNDMAARLEERQAQLVFHAVHDDLTGLTNRFGLLQALDRLLEAGAGERRLAVLFIDLDSFKDVNDTHGHVEGDRLLRMAAERLRGIAVEPMLASRKGGDEFVVVMPEGGTAGAATALADRILIALGEPFALLDGTHTCGASVGIALSPAHGHDSLELLRCADIALYESKRAGRGRATLFEPSLDMELRNRHDLLAALRAGLARRELVVHFQPRLDARSGRVKSAEALVRWNRPGHGLVQPNAFIALAESSGLIDALGQAVLDDTLEQIARWRDAGLRLDRVSVNVSSRQFESGQLVAKVRDALARHGVAPACLELEITESLLSGDISAACSQLVALRGMGITIAMDDFGTGYSSLAQLRALPIDVMKIDRAFVRDLDSDPSALAIARTIVTLGRSLSLRLVAEGVETPGQAEALTAMGCDELQGFQFGRAMHAADFEALPNLERSARLS